MEAEMEVQLRVHKSRNAVHNTILDFCAGATIAKRVWSGQSELVIGSPRTLISLPLLFVWLFLPANAQRKLRG